LVATAWAEDDGELMGVRHREWPMEGVQFHPEALLTEGGLGMIARWVGKVPGQV
jgi:anthranilate/para-aminobenzoate synthase component II